jgi:2-aminoadipate transaminase
VPPLGSRDEAAPMISFARGAPAPECIAVELLADCARVAVERDPSVLAYGPGGGYAPLREWLAVRHGVEPSRVILTNGGLQGIAFVFEELLAQRPGRVLVEAPTYDRPLKLLARAGADVVALPMDDEGLDPDALERELAAGASFLYTIPTFQNPSGRTLSVERRRRVVELAAAHGVPVLEDDPYGLVRYEGEPPPSLHELGGDAVLYASSFSKTVAPGLRVGWFVLPAELAATIEARAVSTYISPPFITQATVFELADRGSFEPNLERIKGLLRERRDAMLAALERELAGRATWSRPDGGYFVWVELPAETGPLLERAEAAGVSFVKGADFFPAGREAASSGVFARSASAGADADLAHGTAGERAARLAFSYESPSSIDEGVSLLASLL